MLYESPLEMPSQTLAGLVDLYLSRPYANPDTVRLFTAVVAAMAKTEEHD